MKKTIVTLIVLLLFTLGFGMNHLTNASEVGHTCERPNPNYCGDNSLTNGLADNETTLFYMYSDTDGMYFLDPLADIENIIFVGHKDHEVLEGLKIDTDSLHHGKRFVGAFADSDLWELVALIEVDIIESLEK